MAEPRKKRVPVADLKEKVAGYIADGMTVDAACKMVDRSRKAYEIWRAQDTEFARRIDLAREKRRNTYERPTPPDFPEFCQTYLRQPLFPHQLRWWDALNGRPPRDLHPSMVYEPGESDLLLFNVPPEHAKTTTLTMNYVTWRIVCDPQTRVLVVSKSHKMAKKFLHGIKTRLTHPSYRRLQEEFGPAEGFEKTADSWTADEIYLASEQSDGEKDPTVQALGIGGHIYGARADLIVLDDTVTLENAHRYEEQIDWITQEVISRIVKGGHLLVIGTRVAAKDLYSELRAVFPGQYTYLAQPAVLEYAEDPKDWKTLWPERHTGPDLEKRKRRTTDATWARAYQQLDVGEDGTFKPEAVRSAVNMQRYEGRMVPGAPGHRPAGMDGLYVVGSMDPASGGFTAMVCYGVDRSTKKRWVIDLENQRDTTPKWKRDKMMDWTERYGISEWRIEDNAYQKSIIQDDVLREWMFSRGVKLTPHHTDRNKWDVDFGVASMETLFLDAGDGKPLIDIPNTQHCPEAAQLVEQLIAWAPDSKMVCDLVMALWFAEIRAREICRQFSNRTTHLSNSYVDRRGRKSQQVISLEQVLQEREQERLALIG